VITAESVERTPLVWRSTPVRALLAAFPLWCTAGVLLLWTVWRQKLLVGAIAALTLASPASGLVAVAALTPFGAILEAVLDLPFRLSEEVVLAFLAAWLIRAAGDRRGPRMPPAMTAAGWLLGVAALASAAALTYERARVSGDIGDIFTWLRQAYFINAQPIGLVDAMRLVEGLGLVGATLHLFRRRPSLAVSLPAALAGSGAVAAILGLLIRGGIGPAFLVARYGSLGYRTGHLLDPNAAGSYFAFVTCLALGMTSRSVGKYRILWAMVAIVNAVGLRATESRSALMAAGVAIVLAVAWRLSARRPIAMRVATMVVLLAIGAGAAAGRATLLERDPTFRGGGFRSQFNEASLRMIAARPLRGVGVGQYYAMSALFLNPQMAYTYGRENAHDYFLQIGAELGVPGLLLFVVWIGIAFVIAARALAVDAEPRLLGAAAGVAALLATCFVSHPLLIGEVAYPFWIGFGLTVGLAQSMLMNATSCRVSATRRQIWPVLGTAGAAIVILIAAAGAHGDGPEPPDAFAVNGLFPADDASPYRWTGEYASVFVPASATRVYIPVRQPVDVHAVSPMGVTVAVGGILQFRTLVGSSPVDLDVPLAPGDRVIGFTRIDIKADRAWQPGVYVAGSSDLRSVGVQVGRYRVIESAGGL